MRRLAAIGLLAVIGSSAQAMFTAVAFSNATIQATGVRQGSNGFAFLNVEGSGNNAFASWGVADFHGDDFHVPFTVAKIAHFRVVLTEADAAFTTPGLVDFWLSSDTGTSILQTGSPLIWQSGVTPSGVGAQLPLVALGEAQFTTTGNTASGQVDTYTFNLSPAAEALIKNAINAHGIIRLVATPNDVAGPANVAATFAGYSNSTYVGPSLKFDALPTPIHHTANGLLLDLTRFFTS